MIPFHAGPGAKLGHISRNPRAAFAVAEIFGMATCEVTGDGNPCRSPDQRIFVLISGAARASALDQSRRPVSAGSLPTVPPEFKPWAN